MPIEKQPDGSCKLLLYVTQLFHRQVLSKWHEGKEEHPTVSLKTVQGASEIHLLYVAQNIEESSCFWQCSCQPDDQKPDECLNSAREYLENQLGFRFSEKPLLFKKFKLPGHQVARLCGPGGQTIKVITKKLGVGVNFPRKGEFGCTLVEGTESAISEFEKEAAGILRVELQEFKKSTYADRVAGGTSKSPGKIAMRAKPILNAIHGEVTECLFFGNHDPKNAASFRVYLDYLLSGDHTLDICVFTITYNKIANAIMSEFRDGVKVRIITDNDKTNDLGSDIYRMATAGVPVKMDKTDAHMHHKFAVIDGKLLINGSFNWTMSAQSRNFENVVISNNPKMVKSFQRLFEDLWNSNQMVSLKC